MFCPGSHRYPKLKAMSTSPCPQNRWNRSSFASLHEFIDEVHHGDDHCSCGSARDECSCLQGSVGELWRQGSDFYVGAVPNEYVGSDALYAPPTLPLSPGHCVGNESISTPSQSKDDLLLSPMMLSIDDLLSPAASHADDVTSQYFLMQISKDKSFGVDPVSVMMSSVVMHQARNGIRSRRFEQDELSPEKPASGVNAMSSVLCPKGSNVLVPKPPSSIKFCPMASEVLSPKGSTVLSPKGSTVLSPKGSTVLSPKGSTVLSPKGSTVLSPKGSSVLVPKPPSSSKFSPKPPLLSWEQRSTQPNTPTCACVSPVVEFEALAISTIGKQDPSNVSPSQPLSDGSFSMPRHSTTMWSPLPPATPCSPTGKPPVNCTARYSPTDSPHPSGTHFMGSPRPPMDPATTMDEPRQRTEKSPPAPVSRGKGTAPTPFRRDIHAHCVSFAGLNDAVGGNHSFSPKCRMNSKIRFPDDHGIGGGEALDPCLFPFTAPPVRGDIPRIGMVMRPAGLQPTPRKNRAHRSEPSICPAVLLPRPSPRLISQGKIGSPDDKDVTKPVTVTLTRMSQYF